MRSNHIRILTIFLGATLLAGTVLAETQLTSEDAIVGPPVPLEVRILTDRRMAVDTVQAGATSAEDIVQPADLRIVTLAPGGPLLESPILSRIEYYHALQATAFGDRLGARRHLVKAVEGDPSLVRAHFLLALHQLRGFEPAWLLTVADGVGALGGNFRSQTLLVANVVILGLFVVFSVLFLLVMVALFRALPAFRHSILEALPSGLPPMVRELHAPVLLVSVFLLFHPWSWTVGAVWILICGILVSWKAFRQSEQIAAALFLGSLLMLPVTYRLAVGAALPTTPGSTLFALAGNPVVTGEGERTSVASAKAGGDQDLLFSLALLERERGDSKGAESLYNEIIGDGGGSAAVWNNLGNLLFFQNKFTDAQNAYQQALLADPRCATTHYNLGQLHLEGFEFEKARKSFTQASELNFNLIRGLSKASAMDDRVTLVDEALPAGRLWGRYLSGGGSEAGPTWSESFAGARRLLFPFPFWAAIPVALLVFGCIKRGRKSPLPGNCQRCHAEICRLCRKREDKLDLCSHCAGTEVAPGTWSLRTLQYHRPVAMSLGLLIPGSSRLYLQGMGRGMFFMIGSLGLLILWAFRGPMIKPFPILSAPDLVPLENLIFAWLFLPLYAWAVVDGLGVVRRHFHKATATETGS